MSKRQQLRDHLDALAREFGPHCPFATSAIHCLVGAIDTGIDREYAAVSVAFMRDQLCITAEMIEESRGRREMPAVSPSAN